MIAIPPTKRFIRLHGNYCGPGNRGGVPIDCLDGICYSHDYHYELSYGKQGLDRIARQRKADLRLIRAAFRIARDCDQRWVVRLKAVIVALYFISRTIIRNRP